ncbi:MipA/OmpV family protein [Microbulbifer magnicolonia]|uniref:MipA/OmpV family protein n=1 Tax=Microbulbifer magnicolonia TaxID=3109744 RepID=UPI002B414B86|nr:MipA/OmpV family protein [Microbulbifer sp. GG15]
MCRILKIITTLLALLAHAGAMADEISVPAWKLAVASGRGVLENPLAGRGKQETFLLPAFSYYGERFFISNLTAGYNLVEEDSFYIDLVARPNEDGLYYLAGDVRVVSLTSLLGLDPYGGDNEPIKVERNVSIVAGPNATLVTDPVDISFSYFHDITGVHNGSETHLSFNKRYRLFGGAISWGLGVVNKDADLVDYYYRLRDTEMGFNSSLWFNQPEQDDVTDHYTRLSYAYPLTKNVELRLAAKYNRFDMDGRHAQLMEKSETLSWFVGIQYSIGSEQ